MNHQDSDRNDAYIVTASAEGVDPIFEEFKAQEVKILSKPQMADYGSYKFAIEDINGRRIGIGRIVDKALYFSNSNYNK